MGTGRKEKDRKTLKDDIAIKEFYRGRFGHPTLGYNRVLLTYQRSRAIFKFIPSTSPYYIDATLRVISCPLRETILHIKVLAYIQRRSGRLTSSSLQRYYCRILFSILLFLYPFEFILSLFTLQNIEIPRYSPIRNSRFFLSLLQENIM